MDDDFATEKLNMLFFLLTLVEFVKFVFFIEGMLATTFDGRFITKDSHLATYELCHKGFRSTSTKLTYCCNG